MNTRFSWPFAAAVALMLGAVVCGETQAQTQLPTVKQRRVTQPAPVIRSAPAVPIFPVAIPETDPNTPLGLAMAQNCATGYPQTTELVLPGANGDIKLDRCYGGREQLSCEFGVLKTEANSLIEKYRRIVEANYPGLQDVAAMCSIQADTLTKDLQGASEFAERFRTLKAEYESKSACAARIQETLKEVTLNDLSQATNVLKSIVDSMDSDMKEVSDMKAQISEFAGRMATSQRVVGTLQKVHRAMCMMTVPMKRHVTK